MSGSPLVLRVCDPADRDAVAALWVLAFYETLGYATSPVTMMQKWLTKPSR